MSIELVILSFIVLVLEILQADVIVNLCESIENGKLIKTCREDDVTSIGKYIVSVFLEVISIFASPFLNLVIIYLQLVTIKVYIINHI